MFYFLHSKHMSTTMRPEINTDDNSLHIPHSLYILHSLHSHHSLHNILHRNTDIYHSKHVCRLDDNPGERADGRVNNSTVHNLVELVWSPSSHSTVLRLGMETLSQRRQRWRELRWTVSSHHLSKASVSAIERRIIRQKTHGRPRGRPGVANLTLTFAAARELPSISRHTKEFAGVSSAAGGPFRGRPPGGGGGPLGTRARRGV